MNSLDKLLEGIAKAPDTQIDASITKQIKGLVGGNPQLIAAELTRLRDECAYSTLASDFAMNVLTLAITTAENYHD